MKTFLNILVALIAIYTSTQVSTIAADTNEFILVRKADLPPGLLADLEAKQKKVVETKGEIVVEYAQYKGEPVSLVVNQQFGRVEVRVRAGKNVGLYADDTLNFLKMEVVRLSSGAQIPLGTTGVKFEYKGLYPVWAPTGLVTKDADYKCLYFANNPKVSSDGVITAIGESEKAGYYPYPERFVATIEAQINKK